MPHPLEQRIAQLTRRWRMLLLLYGAGWLLAVTIAAIVVVSLADYAIRLQDHGVRTIASLAVLVAAGWGVRRFLWPAVAVRTTPVRIAQHVERRFPGFADRLASAVYFLGQPQDDPAEGSAALRRAVVHEVEAEAARLDLDEALDARPTRNAMLAAGAALIVAMGLALLSPISARVALTRLIRPWGADAWPQRHHLAFREPVTRLASGQPFEVEVIDAEGARLPDTVWIEYRKSSLDGGFVEERQRALVFGDALVARQDDVTRSFDYRAVGGDDYSMPWIHVDVLDPPAVDSLSVELHYPAYTGWPSHSGEKQIRAIVGARVALSGVASKPLQQARLHRDGAEPVALTLSDDRHGFSLLAAAEPGFVVEQTGAYWFELEDTDGLWGGADLKYEMRAIPDLAPTVTIEQPSDDLQVTPEAVIPLKISAKDDLAIAAISRLVDRSDQSERESQRTAMYEGPPQPPARSVDGPRGTDAGELRIAEEQLDLQGLELAPGAQLTLRAAAADYRPAESVSPPRRIKIISREEFDDRLAERQGHLAGEMARLLKLEREARAQVTALDIQLREVGRLGGADLDRLQNAEMTQRQIGRGLSGAADGVRGKVRGILSDLSNNRVELPDVERRMRQLADALDALERDPLPAIERDLTSARKQAQAAISARAGSEAAGDMAAAGEALNGAGQRQDEVIEALERQLSELAQWDSYRQFHRDLSQARREQERIGEETAKIGRESIGRDVRDLSPQQRADLQKLAEEQQALARQIEKVEQQMRDAAERLQSEDPAAADVLTSVFREAQQARLTQQMNEAGRNVSNNQTGQASARQQQALNHLREMLDILANRSETSLERLVEKLRAAESQLDEMRRMQQGLRKQMQAAAGEQDPEQRRRQLERLAKQERQLAEQAERLARQLERLQASTASRDTSAAAGSLSQADQAGSLGDGQQAAQAAQQAEQDLEQALAEVAKRRRQAAMDLAFEQLAKIQDALAALHGRQHEAVEEAARLHEIQRQQGRLSRGQAESVGQLARNQRQLGGETQTLVEKLAAAEAFALALRRAGEEMLTAADRFGEIRVDEAAQSPARRALRRLELLLSALEADADGAQGESGEPGGEGSAGGEGQNQAADGIAEIAQLKLIKLMQEEINEQTRTLDQRLGSKTALTADEQLEYARLGEEQGQLADLLRNLAPVVEPDIENDPDRLPDASRDIPQAQDDDAELLDDGESTEEAELDP